MNNQTGLRRGGLASLTPASFGLHGPRPTLTVEAAHSKHRKRDVLPLDDAFVREIGPWIESLESDEPLFPKLAKRRTWLIAKKDLEAAGIPYETDAGFADCDAVRRHSDITDLVRSEPNLAVARDLAKHADVDTTMRYTHLNYDDHAAALRKLAVSPESKPVQSRP